MNKLSSLILLMLLCCFAMVFGVAHLLFGGIPDGLINFLLLTVIGIFIFTCILSLSFFCCHFAKRLYWQKNGYNKYPILIYPFIVVENQKRSFGLTTRALSFLDLVTDFYPPLFIHEMNTAYDDKKATRLCGGAEGAGMIAQTIFHIVMIGALILFHEFYFLPFALLLTIMVIQLNWISVPNLASFGNLRRRKEMKNGRTSIFLSNRAIWYDTDSAEEIYHAAWNKLAENEEYFSVLKIHVAQHLLMIHSMPEAPTLTPDQSSDIAATILHLHLKDFKLSSPDGADLWDAYKAFIIYAVLREDEWARGQWNSNMQTLLRECRELFDGRTIDIFEKYVALGNGSADVFEKYEDVLRREDFPMHFDAYRDLYERIDHLIKSV